MYIEEKKYMFYACLGGIQLYDIYKDFEALTSL